MEWRCTGQDPGTWDKGLLIQSGKLDRMPIPKRSKSALTPWLLNQVDLTRFFTCWVKQLQNGVCTQILRPASLLHWKMPRQVNGAWMSYLMSPADLPIMLPCQEFGSLCSIFRKRKRRPVFLLEQIDSLCLLDFLSQTLYKGRRFCP